MDHIYDHWNGPCNRKSFKNPFPFWINTTILPQNNIYLFIRIDIFISCASLATVLHDSFQRHKRVKHIEQFQKICIFPQFCNFLLIILSLVYVLHAISTDRYNSIPQKILCYSKWDDVMFLIKVLN